MFYECNPPFPLGRIYPGGWALSRNLDVNFIRNEMEIFDDDIWIVTPPKCGTTWMQVTVGFSNWGCGTRCLFSTGVPAVSGGSRTWGLLGRVCLGNVTNSRIVKYSRCSQRFVSRSVLIRQPLMWWSNGGWYWYLINGGILLHMNGTGMTVTNSTVWLHLYAYHRAIIRIILYTPTFFFFWFDLASIWTPFKNLTIWQLNLFLSFDNYTFFAIWIPD